eukprot:gene685-3478_t
MFNLLLWMGCSSRVTLPMRTMYSRLRRRFRIGKAVGAPFDATVGILQGCPISVVFLNAVMAVWAKVVEHEAPGASVDAYADDGDVTASADTVDEAVGIVQTAVDTTADFCDRTGLRLSLRKSTVRCSVAAASFSIKYRGTELARRRCDRILGATTAFDATPLPRALPHIEKRIAAAHKFIGRAGRTPLGLEQKDRLIAAGPIAAFTYGCEVAASDPHRLWRLRQSVADALMPKHARRANEVLLTLFARGHRSDPVQAVVFRTMVTARRMMSRRPALFGLVHHTFELRAQERADGRAPVADGPVRRLYAAADAIGWEWVSPTEVVDRSRGPGAPPVQRDILDTEAPAWAHAVRDALRVTQWTNAEARRRQYSNDMQGISRGIDRRATLALYNNRRTTRLERGYLRVILTGGVLSTKRLAEMKVAPEIYPSDGPCPFCRGAVETVFHMWWECLTWEPLRQRHHISRIRDAARRGTLPNALTFCGLLTEDVDATKLRDPDAPPAPGGGHPRGAPRPRADGKALGPAQPTDDTARGADGEAFRDGRVIVFGDGGCTDHVLDPRNARAGCGAYWGPAHPRNFGLPLPGD